MQYAEVSVNSPSGERQLFSYSIPDNLSMAPGHAVWVPFGSRILQGIVVELSALPAVDQVRPVYGLIEPEPIISAKQLELAQWMSRRYLSPLFPAIALFLPPGFERQPVTYINIVEDEHSRQSLSDGALHILEFIKRKKSIRLKELERRMGANAVRNAMSRLIGSGTVFRSYEIPREKVKPKYADYVKSTIPPATAAESIAKLEKRAKKQAALLKLLLKQPAPIAVSEVVKAGFARTILNSLVRNGLAIIEKAEVRRDPIDYSRVTPSSPLELTTAQSSALASITASLKAGKGTVFLLHGVTGSGKTEVYLRALAEAVKLGKRGIALVPEIALTPQTIERFAGRFPHKVAVLHSRLSIGEQFDQWRDIKSGKYDVVIGARGAIFAPQPDLGLIVIDEEHEWSYKQDGTAPRYHARSVAVELAKLTGATVILGSATPDVESYYKSQTDDYTLLELPERLTPRPGSPMPEMELVDLRDELKNGNHSIFSGSLRSALNDALARNEQSILFFNRRGSASFVQCRNCGLVIRCRRCSTPMSYHSSKDLLLCHQCEWRMAMPEICPRCRSRRIKYLGIGTQKLEEEAAAAFPQARLLRWDSDTTKSKNAHEEIMRKLKTRQTDILIGTQMVAKGLDLPQVTLVGVVSADTALNLPDFRAGERTFQLLSQVAGRAGRGERPGRVIIQTYTPEHYAIQAVLRQDYRAFYEQEITYRRELNAPPFSQIIRLTFSHTNEAICKAEAERLKKQLDAEIAAGGIIDVSVIGPAPAFTALLRGRYRWQLILRGRGPERMFNIPTPASDQDLRQQRSRSHWAIDVDPVGLD
ncbi:MAG: primosomal protein N' [Dehalococcoidia bacterium]|nr:primosomal protein N' [Dehalococcoidia bacterium]